MSQTLNLVGKTAKLKSNQSKSSYSIGTSVKILSVSDAHALVKGSKGVEWMYLSDLETKQPKIKEKTLSRKDMVLLVANKLLKANNTVTTLEVKTALRKEFPGTWKQLEVSNLMMDLASEGKFNYTFNGDYRIYSLKQNPNTKTMNLSSTIQA